jgi:hypothetical protein
LIDYETDGWMDIFILSGTRLEGIPPETNGLHQNFGLEAAKEAAWMFTGRVGRAKSAHHIRESTGILANSGGKPQIEIEGLDIGL